jgi:4-hydroxyphenylpyruvate dioxygenase-like putative hemolysin
MGPFPHDAPPAKISGQNPAGTDGFEFVELPIRARTNWQSCSSAWAIRP